MQTSVLIAILSALTLSASAAPVAERSSQLQCSPYEDARAINLYYQTSSSYDLAFDPNDKKDGHAKLKAVDSTSHKFQFFHCQAPSDKYDGEQGSQYPTYYGQLRSATHPDKCATSGNVLAKSDGKRSQEDSSNSDDIITLQPCATEDNSQLRLQWFGVNTEPDRLPPMLWIQGWKTDVSQDAFIVNDDSSVSPTTRGPGPKKYGLYYVP